MSLIDDMAKALRRVLTNPTAKARANAELTLRIYDANQRKRVKAAEHFQDHKVKIEEHSFPTVRAAFLAAKSQGYDGSEVTFGFRRRTLKTWAEMIKPVDKTRAAARTKTRQIKRDEMANVIKGMK